MTETNIYHGRLGNQIIRNIALHFIAKKNNLAVRYSSHDLIQSLGIELFSGENDFNCSIELTDDNYFDILNGPQIECNINANVHYFQTKDISKMIHNWLHTEMKNSIIGKNPFNERYDNNHDIFLHVRLTDTAQWNLGYDYYSRAINNLQYDKIFLASDDFNHEIVKKLSDNYNIEYFNRTEVDTMQFGSTCKNVILSHGSFSAVIGWLSFYSNIYYGKYRHMWFGDMYSIDGWNELNY